MHDFINTGWISTSNSLNSFGYIYFCQQEEDPEAPGTSTGHRLRQVKENKACEDFAEGGFGC